MSREAGEEQVSAEAVERLGKALMLVAIVPALLSFGGAVLALGPAFMGATLGAVTVLGILGFGVMRRRRWAAWATAALFGASALATIAATVSSALKQELDLPGGLTRFGVAMALVTASRLYARAAKSI